MYIFHVKFCHLSILKKITSKCTLISACQIPPPKEKGKAIIFRL